MTPDETDHWETNGYFMRKNVFSHKENDQLRQVAEDIAIGKRKMPMAHIDHGPIRALARGGGDDDGDGGGTLPMTQPPHHQSA